MITVPGQITKWLDPMELARDSVGMHAVFSSAGAAATNRQHCQKQVADNNKLRDARPDMNLHALEIVTHPDGSGLIAVAKVRK